MLGALLGAQENPIQDPGPSEAIPTRVSRLRRTADCWHLVACGPWTTGHTGLNTIRLVGFQDCIRGAWMAGSRISVNVVTSRTRGAGGAHVWSFKGTGTAVGGNPIHDIGDIDGVDLSNIIGVLPALETRKQEGRGRGLSQQSNVLYLTILEPDLKILLFSLI
jgi:hypothetical protein